MNVAGWLERAALVEHAGARVVFCSENLEAALGGGRVPEVKALVSFGSDGYERLASGERRRGVDPRRLAHRAGWFSYAMKLMRDEAHVDPLATALLKALHRCLEG